MNVWHKTCSRKVTPALETNQGHWDLQLWQMRPCLKYLNNSQVHSYIVSRTWSFTKHHQLTPPEDQPCIQMLKYLKYEITFKSTWYIKSRFSVLCYMFLLFGYVWIEYNFIWFNSRKCCNTYLFLYYIIKSKI